MSGSDREILRRAWARVRALTVWLWLWLRGGGRAETAARRLGVPSSSPAVRLRAEDGWIRGGARLSLVTCAAVLFLVLGGWLSRASASDVYDSITVGGSSLVVTLSSSGDRGFITFSGTAGQYLGLGVSSNSISNLSVTVSSGLVSGTVGTSGGEFDFQIPSTGTYTITVDPPGSSTGSLTLTLSQDLSDTITAGGSTVDLDIDRLGQNGRVTFSGTANQRVGLGFSGISGGLVFDAKLLNPSGGTVSSATAVDSPGVEFDSLLPSTGTYTIFVDARIPYTGSVTLTLSNDLTDTITVDGSAVDVELDRVGENARVTFSGTANQRVGLGFSGVSGGLVFDATLLNPSGGTVSSALAVGSSGHEFDSLLPSTGTYTIVVDARIAYTGSVTLTLSNDLTDTITVDGSAVGLRSTGWAKTAASPSRARRTSGSGSASAASQAGSCSTRPC